MTEQKLKKLIGLMSLMGIIGSMGLMGCSSENTEEQGSPTPPPTEVAISFSGSESQENAVTRAAGTPLSAAGVSQFHVWGYKNMDYNDGSGAYGGTQTVFPGYQVDWHDNTAATTTTNSSGWEYIQPGLPDQTIKYWDWGAKAYRYFAVTGTPTHTLNGTAHEFTFNADASDVDAMAATPYFTRLWFSTGNQVAYPDKQFGKAVQLDIYQKSSSSFSSSLFMISPVTGS